MNAAITRRQRIYRRDRGRCGLCRQPVAFDATMHLDHIVPRCAGGADDDRNLQTAHASCNLRAGAKGYAPIGYAPPSCVPAMRRSFARGFRRGFRRGLWRGILCALLG